MLATLGGLSFFGASAKTNHEPAEEFVKVMGKDGKMVKVPASVLNKAKVVNTQIGNGALLNWLKRK